MSPGAALTSEGVKTRDLLTVGDPTTIVIILEKGATGAPALAEGEGRVEVLEAAVPAKLPLADFMGCFAKSKPSSMSSADCGNPGKISNNFCENQEFDANLEIGCVFEKVPPTI